jgi:hypothetical protein
MTPRPGRGCGGSSAPCLPSRCKMDRRIWRGCDYRVNSPGMESARARLQRYAAGSLSPSHRYRLPAAISGVLSFWDRTVGNTARCRCARRHGRGRRSPCSGFCSAARPQSRWGPVVCAPATNRRCPCRPSSAGSRRRDRPASGSSSRPEEWSLSHAPARIRREFSINRRTASWRRTTKNFGGEGVRPKSEENPYKITFGGCQKSLRPHSRPHFAHG